MYVPDPFLGIAAPLVFLGESAHVQGMGSFQLIGHIIAANMLTLACFWGAWTIHRAESQTGNAKNAPWLAFAAVIVPPVIVAASGYLGIAE